MLKWLRSHPRESQRYCGDIVVERDYVKIKKVQLEDIVVERDYVKIKKSSARYYKLLTRYQQDTNKIPTRYQQDTNKIPIGKIL